MWRRVEEEEEVTPQSHPSTHRLICLRVIYYLSSAPTTTVSELKEIKCYWLPYVFSCVRIHQDYSRGKRKHLEKWEKKMTDRICNTFDNVLRRDFYNKYFYEIIVSEQMILAQERLYVLFSWLAFREIHTGHKVSSPEGKVTALLQTHQVPEVDEGPCRWALSPVKRIKNFQQ